MANGHLRILHIPAQIRDPIRMGSGADNIMSVQVCFDDNIQVVSMTSSEDDLRGYVIGIPNSFRSHALAHWKVERTLAWAPKSES